MNTKLTFDDICELRHIINKKLENLDHANSLRGIGEKSGLMQLVKKLDEAENQPENSRAIFDMDDFEWLWALALAENRFRKHSNATTEELEEKLKCIYNEIWDIFVEERKENGEEDYY